MYPDSSPFSPGQPVLPEFFVGRSKQITDLISMVKSTTENKRFRIGYVYGERGIGKSSLVSAVSYVMGKEHSDLLTAHVFLGGVTKLEDMVFKTFEGLIRESSKNKTLYEHVKQVFGDKLRQLEFGVGIPGASISVGLNFDSDEDKASLTRQFVPSIRNLIGDDQSILLILDDINGLADTSEFANWLKSTVDECSLSNIRLCVLVVGLEDRRRQLVGNQESLARVFELIDIKPWSNEEVKEFYDTNFERANATIDPGALDLIIQYTGGLPVLAHEIGDSVWRMAKEHNITYDNVVEGIHRAAEIIGLKYLEPKMLDAVHSETYHSIFQKLSASLPDMTGRRFQRAQLIEMLTPSEAKSVDYFLKRMTTLGVIAKDSNIRGSYHYPNELYALYFYMISSKTGGS